MTKTATKNDFRHIPTTYSALWWPCYRRGRFTMTLIWPMPRK